MKTPDEPSPEVVAATDAVFEEGSPTAAEPAHPPSPPAPPAAKPEVKPLDKAESPLEDYVRELGQEYEQQQDEGRL
jgi:hypothetical protein